MLATDPIRTTARALRRLIRKTGGVTFDHDSGRLLREGIAVCAGPETAWRFPLTTWDDRLVGAWLHEQRHRLAYGDVHVGGWLEPPTGAVWLELVWVLPERLMPAAVALGRLHEQYAVFDLGRGRLVVLEADQDVDVG